MDPDSPKPPVAPTPKPATPRADDGPRWLSRPERAVQERGANAPPPAAGSPPVTPVTPQGVEPANMAQEPVPVPVEGGRWGIYVRVGGIAVLAASAVVAALIFAARAPGNAESATRSLTALATARATPSATPSETATATATPSETPTAVPIPIPTAAPESIPSAAPTPTATASTTPPAAPTPAAGEGTISTPPNAAGHRVFVDDRYAGDSPGPIKVRCGKRVVKVGSGGTPHAVDVPCGGDVLVPTR